MQASKGGARVRQLEQEVKLDVSPGWVLPDLSTVLPGVALAQLPALRLEATYYDTALDHLAARRMTLRYRRESETRGSTRHIWTVKLPTEADTAVLSRTELSWEVRRPPSPKNGALPVHPEVAELLGGVTLGQALQPIAHLATRRLRVRLETSDGRPLAEVAQDSVTGTDLRHLGPGGRARPPVSFRELEVELAEGSSLEVLESLADRLVDAGARRSTRVSKLRTVLDLSGLPPAPGANAATGTATAAATGGATQAAHGGAHAAAGAAARPPASRPPRRHPGLLTMGDVLRQQAADCLNTLLEHDIALRLEEPDPEHVHRSRVATRRLRSLLRAFSPLTGAHPWFEELRGELSWLGEVLGNARDADVRSETLQQSCARLGKEDVDGAHSVLSVADADRSEVHGELLAALASERYLSCLRRLDALGNTGRNPAPAPPAAVPATRAARSRAARATAARSAGGAVGGAERPPSGLWLGLTGPATIGLPDLAFGQWRALRKKVRRAAELGEEPPEDRLHKVRIEAKRLRYISEAAAPVLPARDKRAALATAKAATALQDILGVEHDASVNEQWLRAVPGRVAAQTTGRGRQHVALVSAVTAGQLVAMAREAQRANRKAWQKAWRELQRTKHLNWMGPGRAGG